MAYSDRRRDTWAAIFEKKSRPYVWLWLNPETGKPEVTRRTVGLRKYFPVSQRQETITFSDWVKRTYHDDADPTNYSGAWSGSRPTGLHITRLRDSSGEEFDLPAMGNGTTVWIEDPNPGKNEAVREPLPEAVSVPEEPEPEYDLTPVEVGALQARVAELEAEVARLKAKYETPCPGLVTRYPDVQRYGLSQPEIVKCGGFLGHPGDCAEVW